MLFKPKFFSRKLVLKASLSCMLIYTLIIMCTTLTKIAKSNYMTFEESFKLRFKIWTNDFLLSSYDVEANERFMKKLDEVRMEKVKNDYKNNFWYMDDSIGNKLPLDISIPEYFYDKTIPKPIVQPFDPRLTVAIYLNYIKEDSKLKVPFHWSDWLDLGPVFEQILSDKKYSCDQYLLDAKYNKVSGIIDLKKYCEADKNSPLNYKIYSYTGRHSINERVVLGKAYLYSTAVSPSKLVFMTSEKGSYEVEVLNHEKNDFESSLLRNNIIERLLQDQVINKVVNPLKSYKELVASQPPKNYLDALDEELINISKELFDVNFNDEILKLEADESSLSPGSKSYLNSLRYSETLKSPPKYFSEALLTSDVKDHGKGTHYDWRFFNGLVDGDVQSMHLHRLIKSYLNFARQHKFITWIAHGSLLSWYWNGVAFPWDSDIDVQMPISEILRMSKHFNQSLIIENTGTNELEFSGLGRYFIDVGSSVTYRVNGNGKNNIDARFIDVDTGLYIDITGLAVSNRPAPPRYNELSTITHEEIGKYSNDVHMEKNRQLGLYNCRNNHFASYDELSPLMLTSVENQLSYVPSNFFKTLSYEYKLNGISEKNFKDYIYLKNLRIWVTTQVVLDYINDPALFMYSHNSALNNPEATLEDLPNTLKSRLAKRLIGVLEKGAINNLSEEDHINLLQNNHIFQEFYNTHEFTKFHEREMKYLFDGEFNSIKSLRDEFNSRNSFGKPLRPDIFMDRLFKTSWDFDAEVKKYQELSSQKAPKVS